MGNPARERMSASEYLEFERNSPEKHEFYNGEIYAMAGAKEKHNLLVSNLTAAIPTLDLTLSLLDIYDKVEFENQEDSL